MSVGSSDAQAPNGRTVQALQGCSRGPTAIKTLFMRTPRKIWPWPLLLDANRSKHLNRSCRHRLTQIKYREPEAFILFQTTEKFSANAAIDHAPRPAPFSPRRGDADQHRPRPLVTRTARQGVRKDSLRAVPFDRSDRPKSVPAGAPVPDPTPAISDRNPQ